MKTADDWDKFFSERYDARKHPEWKIKSDLEMFSDMCNHIQLDAFKAGAEWATAHRSIPTEIEEEIKFMASSLKEIPK